MRKQSSKMCNMKKINSVQQQSLYDVMLFNIQEFAILALSLNVNDQEGSICDTRTKIPW